MNSYTFYILTKWVRSPRGAGCDSLNVWIVRMHTLRLSPAHILSHYKQKVRELVKHNITIESREKAQFHETRKRQHNDILYTQWQPIIEKQVNLGASWDMTS